MLPNVVIVGAPKSGTTSLYHWLVDHPQVAGPSRKETGYFVDADSHAFRPRSNYLNHGVAGYERNFDESGPDVRVILEVAPDYMCQSTALEALPSLRSRPDFLFILREPAAQIYSLFRYLQNNWQYVPEDMSFETFVGLARTRSDALGHHELLQHALDNARYVELIDRWVARAGLSRIRIYLFEELVSDSREFMRRMCRHLGIAPTYYDDYAFASANETYQVRSGLLQSTSIALRAKLPKGKVYKRLRWLYRKLNTTNKRPVTSDRDIEILDALRVEFREPNRRLSERFGLDLSSWDRGRR